MSGLAVADIALVIAVLVAFGYVLLGAVALLPGRRDQGIELIRIFFSATLIVAVLTACALIGPAAMAPLMLVVAARTSWEAAHVRLGAGRAAGLVGLLAPGLTAAAMVAPLAVPALSGLWLLLLARVVMVPARPDSRAMALAELLVFPIIPLALLAHGATGGGLLAAVLAAYLLVEIFDSFALLSGKLMGRTPAFPRLSPRKTVEGLAGGALALIAIVASGAWALGLDLAGATGAALAAGGLAIAGDLAGSRLKRAGGVKDFPVVLKRQGGLLDSLDSWIAAGAGLVALQFAAQAL